MCEDVDATECYPLWFFETATKNMACGYRTTSHTEAIRLCEQEYGVSVKRAAWGRLPFPEYRALLSVNREGYEWPIAYSALIGVFLDAYSRRSERMASIVPCDCDVESCENGGHFQLTTDPPDSFEQRLDELTLDWLRNSDAEETAAMRAHCLQMLKRDSGV